MEQINLVLVTAVSSTWSSKGFFPEIWRVTLASSCSYSTPLHPWILIISLFFHELWPLNFTYLFIYQVQLVRPVVFIGKHTLFSTRLKVNSNLFLKKTSPLTEPFSFLAGIFDSAVFKDGMRTNSSASGLAVIHCHPLSISCVDEQSRPSIVPLDYNQPLKWNQPHFLHLEVWAVTGYGCTCLADNGLKRTSLKFAKSFV